MLNAAAALIVAGRAELLPDGVTLAREALASGTDLGQLEAQARETLDARGWATDYLTVRRRSDLLPPAADQRHAGDMVVLGASRLGTTRLIDNLEF